MMDTSLLYKSIQTYITIQKTNTMALLSTEQLDLIKADVTAIVDIAASRITRDVRLSEFVDVLEGPYLYSYVRYHGVREESDCRECMSGFCSSRYHGGGCPSHSVIYDTTTREIYCGKNDKRFYDHNLKNSLKHGELDIETNFGEICKKLPYSYIFENEEEGPKIKLFGLAMSIYWTRYSKRAIFDAYIAEFMRLAKEKTTSGTIRDLDRYINEIEVPRRWNQKYIQESIEKNRKRKESGFSEIEKQCEDALEDAKRTINKKKQRMEGALQQEIAQCDSSIEMKQKEIEELEKKKI